MYFHTLQRKAKSRRYHTYVSPAKYSNIEQSLIAMCRSVGNYLIAYSFSPKKINTKEEKIKLFSMSSIKIDKFIDLFH